MSCSVVLPRILHLKPEYREIRRFDRADWSATCLDMLTDWEPMLQSVDFDAKLDEFMLIWDAVMGRHCRRHSAVHGSGITPSSRR